MESKGDEASHQHPKQSKPTNHSPFPSTSIQESSLTISILPQELITDILLKLPVKPLLKFRCVSKSWLALISSPQFVKTHLSVSVNNKECTNHRVVLKVNSPEFNLKDCSLNSLLYDPVTEAFDLGYPMKNPRKARRSIRIVGSVNGLICLVIGVNDFFLWNPSIRKFKKLPDPTDGFYIMYGFGYDEFHDDYKVVAICNNLRYNGSHHVEVKIYSLKSDSWTSTYECWSGGVLSTRWGTLVNGKLHWTTTTTTTRVGVNNPKDIICIDLADKKWGKVEQPCYGEGDFNCTLSLGVLGGDLSLFYDYLRTHADVWVMKEYGVKESWTKMLTINYPNDPTAYLFLHTFCMSNKGEILFEFGSSFVVYNLNDNSIRNPEITNCAFIRQAIIYIESLVWPLLDKEPIIQQQ